VPAARFDGTHVALSGRPRGWIRRRNAALLDLPSVSGTYQRAPRLYSRSPRTGEHSLRPSGDDAPNIAESLPLKQARAAALVNFWWGELFARELWALRRGWIYYIWHLLRSARRVGEQLPLVIIRVLIDFWLIRVCSSRYVYCIKHLALFVDQCAVPQIGTVLFMLNWREVNCFLFRESIVLHTQIGDETKRACVKVNTFFLLSQLNQYRIQLINSKGRCGSVSKRCCWMHPCLWHMRFLTLPNPLGCYGAGRRKCDCAAAFMVFV
jgi:hypothetical protein